MQGLIGGAPQARIGFLHASEIKEGLFILPGLLGDFASRHVCVTSCGPHPSLLSTCKWLYVREKQTEAQSQVVRPIGKGRRLLGVLHCNGALKFPNLFEKKIARI